ncbi:hypothetical protein EV702DRAFT_230679 [Suillus placidus]|uniref:Uncharacterized protein n=1 Tax=Suillus placidus TaxID=48579 RepID=A0A9P7A5H4_9AGAM|nr:hypothetical protein EV702DRAFT_230679 [Suillus placidus]
MPRSTTRQPSNECGLTTVSALRAGRTSIASSWTIGRARDVFNCDFSRGQFRITTPVVWAGICRHSGPIPHEGGTVYVRRQICGKCAWSYVMLLWGMLYFMLAFFIMSTPTWTLAFTGNASGLLFILWLASATRDFYLLTWLLAWLKAWIRL